MSNGMLGKYSEIWLRASGREFGQRAAVDMSPGGASAGASAGRGGCSALPAFVRCAFLRLGFLIAKYAAAPGTPVLPRSGPAGRVLWPNPQDILATP